MSLKKTGHNFTLIALAILFAVAAFEIIAYFFFIYKPASQIFGKNKSYPLEIPAISQVTKPTQLTNSTMSLADTKKQFFPGKLFNFSSQLESRLTGESTFIKNAAVSYIVAGDVSSVNTDSNGSVTIELKNSTGETSRRTFSAEDLKDVEVSLITLSLTNPSRADSSLEKTIPGDYLILKVSANILDENPKDKMEVEIVRTVK